MTRFIHSPSCSSLALAAGLLAGASATFTASSSSAAMKSWTTGDGSWNVGANWSPIGVPGPADDVFIGNLFAVENDWVTLAANTTVASLSITDGMALNTDGRTFSVAGTTLISGYNSDGVFGYPSRLVVTQGPAATDCTLDQAQVEDEGWIQIQEGAVLRMNGVLDIGPGCLLFGEGQVLLESDQAVAMRVDGYIGAGTAGLTITQLGNGRIDLDGVTAGDQTLNITLGKIDGSEYEWITINGDGLLDTFDEDI